MGMKQYDPKGVTISWNGINLNEGIAAGTFILASRTSRNWAIVIGGDGEATRVRLNDKSGTVTVTLRQGSASNLALQAILDGDQLLGSALGGLLANDTQGLSLIVATSAFIEGEPDWERSDGEGNVEWVFLAPKMKLTHAGNADANA